MTTLIPRRIIQTDKSSNLPLTLKAATSSLRLHNPDFEYLFFDDAAVEHFIDGEYPQYRKVVDGFRFRIQRYDFFRYLAVHRFGGFYFDTDVLCARPLDDLLAYACVFPFEELSVHDFLIRNYDLDWEIGNYAFGAAAGHPVIEAIIGNCVRAQQNPDWAREMMAPIPQIFRREFLVYDTTGPGLVTRTLAERPNAGNEIKVLFAGDVRDEATWHCFGDYAVHLQSGTWRSPQSFLYRRLFRLWETRQRKRRAADSRRRGPTRALQPQMGRA